MAVSATAAEKAALEKSRAGKKLNDAERKLITAYTSRVNQTAKESGNVVSGQGAYSTGGNNLEPAAIQASYDNFIQNEQTRRAQGLPPRQLPVQFASIARFNNPLNYNLNSTETYQTPVANTAGFNDLVNNGILDQSGGLLINGQSVGQVGLGQLGNPYAQAYSTMANKPNLYNALPVDQWAMNPVTPQPQVNPGVPQQQTAPQTGGTLNVTGGSTQAGGPSYNDLFPSAPSTVRNPAGGARADYTEAGQDVGKLIAEAELQKQLNTQTHDAQSSARKQYLSELSDMLVKQQQAQLNDQMPGIYEDLNTRGLLRSSALGEKVGLEASKLARQTSEQLALQGLTDRRDQLTQAGAIQDQYLAGRNAAIQRGFSVEDFNRQAAVSKEIGSAVTPVASSGGSGKGGSTMGGVIGGASIGSKFGPTGALIGGATGGLLGSTTSGK